MAVSRDRRRPRHRAESTLVFQARPTAETDDQPDPELVSYLAALTADEPGPAETTQRLAATQPLTVRLPSTDLEQLCRLADARDTTPADLVAEWVRERLATESTDTGPLPRLGFQSLGRLGRRGSR